MHWVPSPPPHGRFGPPAKWKKEEEEVFSSSIHFLINRSLPKYSKGIEREEDDASKMGLDLKSNL